MDDRTYSQLLEDRAKARRAAQANGQALIERESELAYARPMADAAYAYCAARELPIRQRIASRELDLYAALMAAHRATTPSQVPSSHVIVERGRLALLETIEKCAQMYANVRDADPDGHEWYDLLALLGTGA